MIPDSSCYSPYQKNACHPGELLARKVYAYTKFTYQNREEQTVTTTIMSSTNRDGSPSVKDTNPHTTDSQISVEHQLTESEKEIMSGNDEPKSTEKCSRNVKEKIVCWKFFSVPPKVTCFSCSHCEFLGFQFRTGERKT